MVYHDRVSQWKRVKFHLFQMCHFLLHCHCGVHSVRSTVIQYLERHKLSRFTTCVTSIDCTSNPVYVKAKQINKVIQKRAKGYLLHNLIGWWLTFFQTGTNFVLLSGRLVRPVLFWCCHLNHTVYCKHWQTFGSNSILFHNIFFDYLIGGTFRCYCCKINRIDYISCVKREQSRK